MPKAKPVSLFPLNFDEAIAAFMRVDLSRVGLGSKRTKSKGQRKHKRRASKK